MEGRLADQANVRTGEVWAEWVRWVRSTPHATGLLLIQERQGRGRVPTHRFGRQLRTVAVSATQHRPHHSCMGAMQRRRYTAGTNPEAAACPC